MCWFFLFRCYRSTVLANRSAVRLAPLRAGCSVYHWTTRWRFCSRIETVSFLSWTFCIKTPHYWPFVSGTTGERRFPSQRANNSESVSMSWLCRAISRSLPKGRFGWQTLANVRTVSNHPSFNRHEMSRTVNQRLARRSSVNIIIVLVIVITVTTRCLSICNRTQ